MIIIHLNNAYYILLKYAQYAGIYTKMPLLENKAEPLLFFSKIPKTLNEETNTSNILQYLSLTYDLRLPNLGISEHSFS